MKRKIPVREILADIRGGFGDVPVMEKYGLSPEELTLIKHRWGEASLNSPGRGQEAFAETLTGIERRALPRREPLYEISICEKGNIYNKGIIHDIHLRGLRIRGIVVITDQTTTLVVSSEPLRAHATFTFQAECRWSMIDEQGQCVAGFRITKVSPEDFKEFGKLIDRLTARP